MSSRPTEKASGLTMALTGMSLAVGIAREATDAVPIVKQCLGSAMRIVAFAEKMDKDRQALHELADKSLQLARRVKDVMAGRTPDAKVELSLERILKALESIEAFMQKHSARSRLYRLVAYAFTVPQHVERLSRELADAVQELIVVVLLDVDHHVQATHRAVDENAQFAGEFRLLRHCEVQKFDRLVDFEDGENATAVFQYHRAHIDGQVLVVRYIQGRTPQHSPSGQEPGEIKFNRIAYHDRILEISTVQRSHPNVARIYGWGRGSFRTRFTVFKCGFQPVLNVLRNSPNPLITGIQWAAKLLDAVQHLELMGIVWSPEFDHYELDDQLQPIIGRQNDLYRVNERTHDWFEVAQNQIFTTTLPLQSFAQWQPIPASKIQKLLAGCLNKRLANLVGKMELITRRRYMVPRAEFSDCRIMTDAAAKYLLRILEDEVLDHGWRNEFWTWANILSALAKNGSRPLMRSLSLVYFCWRDATDSIRLYGIDQDSERIVYDKYTFYVPLKQQPKLRRMFGISVPSVEKPLTSHLIATGPYRMLLD